MIDNRVKHAIVLISWLVFISLSAFVVIRFTNAAVEVLTDPNQNCKPVPTVKLP